MNAPVQPLNYDTVLLAIIACVGWACARIVRERVGDGLWRRMLVPLSFFAAWIFWGATVSVAGSVVDTASDWSPTMLGVIAAISSEFVLTLYVDHRASRAGWTNWVPVALRLVLIAILVFILLEPIISHHEEHLSERYVAVLVDASASMELRNGNDAADSDKPGLSRRETARRVLLESQAGDEPLLEQLEADYNVRLYEFASSPREVALADWRAVRGRSPAVHQSEPSNDWHQSTDIAAAINRIGDQSLKDLSGVILLTDGCDHSPVNEGREDAVRQFVHRDVAIHCVVIGDQTPIRDAEVITVQAPQHLFLGDSAEIRASIKVDGFGGESVMVTLSKDGEPLDEKQLRVASERHRENVSFEHVPDDVGVHEYSVDIAPLTGERIADNNRRSARVWVSKDYIRMLIVDQRPRWEFRYLRNLFAGRDRSVFLQYVLLKPDRLAGVPKPPVLRASVARAFDDCEATAVPESESEWLKFDVIVLGDVAPEDLGDEVIQTLQKFVNHRGGTLIVISGRSQMPHAYLGSPLADLLPVELTGASRGDAGSPDLEYRLRVGSAGRSHAIMKLSPDEEESQSTWQSLPTLYWRHPASRAKAGATVLAYADDGPGGIADAQSQRERALILWHRSGAGRVLQLTFDQTWRLRYGVGDQYHHRFWGQVLRWSVQERLTAGTEMVRLGTDRVHYRAGETVAVRARLLDEDRNPVETLDARILVYLGSELIAQTALTPQPDSGGMLSAKVNDLDHPGKYRIELVGTDVDRLLQIEGQNTKRVFTEISVEGADPVAEMSDIAADPSIPLELADWTDGIVKTPDCANELLSHLGPETTFTREQWTVPLWNAWPVLALFLLILSAEWGLRRSTGLI